LWVGNQGHERDALEKCEAEFLSEQRFLGELVAKGGGIFRHNQNGRRDINEETLSARRIVSHLLAKSDVSTPPPLRLQREIIDQGKTLGETAAGESNRRRPLQSAERAREGIT
jgi:hypothetical protein